jgi:hypothetical protein
MPLRAKSEGPPHAIGATETQVAAPAALRS